jgi:hypothetical protein
MNRIRNLIAVFAFSLLVLALPSVASAQWRNDRNNNGGYGNGSYNRNLQSTIKNLKNRSRSFAKQLDRELDRSRYDDRRREDRLNNLARDFENATDNLDDRYDNRRDYNSSTDEVRRVIQLGSQIDNALRNTRLSSNVQNQWNQIRQDLQVLASSYNGNNNNRNRRNNRNDDDDDDDYNNNRNRRTNNGDWRRKIPFPLPF